MSDRSCTVILMNYMRPTQMKQVLDAVGRQTLTSHVMLCDNSPEPQEKDRKVDRLIRAAWNANTYIRLFAAFYVATPWVIFLDDDLFPMDAKVFEDAVDLAAMRPGAITGIFGRSIGHQAPYYREDKWGNVPIVKGRFMVFRKEILAKVHLLRWPLHWNPNYLGRVDDIYFSLETGGGDSVHWADERLRERFHEFPEGPEALCMEPHHRAIRESFVKEYMAMLRKGPCLPSAS